MSEKYEKIVFKITMDGQGFMKELKMLDRRKHLVGRAAKWLRLNHTSVSRKHAYVGLIDDRILVFDNESSNGVFVNGKEMVRAEAKVGDVIKFGDVEAQIVSFSASKEEPRPIMSDEEMTRTGAILLGGEQAQEDEPPKPKAESKREPSQSEVSASLGELDESSKPKRKKESSESGWGDAPPEDQPESLEDLQWDFVKIVEHFKGMILNPKNYFQTTNFSGDIKNTLIWLAISGVVSALFGTLASGALGLALIPTTLIFTFFGAFLGAGIFFVIRGLIGAEGEFENYLRFIAHIMVIYIPTTLIGLISTTLAGLASLGVTFLSFAGFFWAFKPDLKKYIIVMVLIYFFVLGPIFMMATCSMMASTLLNAGGPEDGGHNIVNVIIRSVLTGDNPTLLPSDTQPIEEEFDENEMCRDIRKTVEAEIMAAQRSGGPAEVQRVKREIREEYLSQLADYEEYLTNPELMEGQDEAAIQQIRSVYDCVRDVLKSF